MKKFKKFGFVGGIMAAGVLLVSFGCEWDGGGDGYNSRYEWADFNGVYSGFNGLLLVTDYSAKPGTQGTVYPGSQNFGSALVDNQTPFSGKIKSSLTPIISGSFTVMIGDDSYSDDGSGSLEGPYISSGFIDIETGSWGLTLNAPNGIKAGDAISASFNYAVSGITPPGPGSGASGGIKIHTFTVQQQGNSIIITDNNGSVYQGKLGSTRLNEGSLDAGVPVIGSSVAMQFNASGTSAAGYQVKIVGTLQGVVTDSDGRTITLSDRRMYGTWIETGGRTGDINGESSPLSLIVPASTVEP